MKLLFGQPEADVSNGAVDGAPYRVGKLVAAAYVALVPRVHIVAYDKLDDLASASIAY